MKAFSWGGSRSLIEPALFLAKRAVAGRAKERAARGSAGPRPDS